MATPTPRFAMLVRCRPGLNFIERFIIIVQVILFYMVYWVFVSAVKICVWPTLCATVVGALGSGVE